MVAKTGSPIGKLGLTPTGFIAINSPKVAGTDVLSAFDFCNDC